MSKGCSNNFSPEFTTYYKFFDSKQPLIYDDDSNEEFGRFLGICLSFRTKINVKGDFRTNKKKNIFQIINLFLTPVYHPVDAKDQLIFNNYLSTNYKSVPSNNVLMPDQDIGVGKVKSECKNIGAFGIDNRNVKGVEVVNLLRMNNYFALLIFLTIKIESLGGVLMKKYFFKIKSLN